MVSHITIPHRPSRGRLQVRSLLWIVAASAVGAWLGRDPFASALVLALLFFAIVGVVVMAVFMGLGALGFVLWAAIERIVLWVRRASTFPEDHSGE